MRFERVRSGLAETVHHADVVAIDAADRILFASGDIDRTIFHRSSIKPFQALAMRRIGLELPAEHMAVTCSSHGGYPVHVAIVVEILRRHGLTPGDLRTPPDRPADPSAANALETGGYTIPSPLFHNCSGKHAGFLAACVVAGYDTVDYLAGEHPLQRVVLDTVAQIGRMDPEPVGIDGCGAPTLRGSVTSLARMFAQLGVDPEMEPIAHAMTAYGALVADNRRGDGRFGTSWGGPSKGGAAGVFAASRSGVGIAAKCGSGHGDVAVAAVLEVADRLGMLSRGDRTWLDNVRHPAVLGGGHPVGRLEVTEI